MIQPTLSRTVIDVPSPRPTTTRQKSGQSPLATLVRRYDVGDAVRFHPLSTGLLNRSFKVTTTGGEYFLKHYLDAAPEAIGYQHQATAILADAGLPVMPPLRDATGRTWLSVRGRRFALFPWVDGAHREGVALTGDCAARLGDLLARVHRQLAVVLAPTQQTLVVPTPTVAGSMDRVNELLTLVRRQPVRDGLDELAEHRLVERRHMLYQYAHRRPDPGDTLLSGYVHGDLHPLNLLYQGREPIAILDWDRLGVQPYTEELVRAASLFFRSADEGLDTTKIRRYVAAYRAVQDLDDAQLASAVHRLWWDRLNDFWMLEGRYQRRDRRCDSLFLGVTTLVSWWNEHYDEVLRAFLCR